MLGQAATSAPETPPPSHARARLAGEYGEPPRTVLQLITAYGPGVCCAPTCEAALRNCRSLPARAAEAGGPTLESCVALALAAVTVCSRRRTCQGARALLKTPLGCMTLNAIVLPIPLWSWTRRLGEWPISPHALADRRRDRGRLRAIDTAEVRALDVSAMSATLALVHGLQRVISSDPASRCAVRASSRGNACRALAENHGMPMYSTARGDDRRLGALAARDAHGTLADIARRLAAFSQARNQQLYGPLVRLAACRD